MKRRLGMKQSSSKRYALCAGLAFCLAAIPVLADEQLLRGKQVTEENLIQALTPPPEEGSAPPVRTRSISVQRVPRGAATEQTRATTATKPASASLLITFTTNSSDLTEEARAALDVVARALQADRLANFNFAIEGHADARGNSDENLKLSQERAESVVTYLVGRHHIDSQRLRPIGKGSTEPMNTGRIDAPENRRVTITTLSK
jgi:outer membrane protein OmpA-like peptidoglycan-associated protein